MNKNVIIGFIAGTLTLCMVNEVNAAMVAHWGFDETSGTTVYDSIGTVDGALVGGASFTGTSGIIGGAIEISDGYVDMGDNFPASPAFSVQAWIKTNPGDTSGLVPLAKHWGTIAQGYFLSINDIGDGYTRVNTASFYSANGSYVTAVGGQPVNDGLWHHLIGVFDNGSTSIYIDGGLAGSGAAGFSDNPAHFMIGGLFFLTEHLAMPIADL